MPTIDNYFLNVVFHSYKAVNPESKVSFFERFFIQLETSTYQIRVKFIEASEAIIDFALRINDYYQSRQVEVSERYETAGEKFINDLPRIIALSEQQMISKGEKEAICQFFTYYSFLPSAYFDRSAILGGNEKLQRILSPELDALVREQEENGELEVDPEHQFKILNAQAKLAAAVGLEMKQAGGCNGARFVKNLEGENIGIFKPNVKKTLNPLRAIKAFVGQARLLDNSNNKEQVAEVAMHIYDDVFELNLAPQAKMLKMNNQTGAFVSFLKEYDELAKVREDFDARPEYTKEEKIKWQKAMVAIFTTMNYDPHDENIFVKIDDNGRLTDIKIIDAGNAIRVNRLPSFGPKGHRSKPGEVKISHEKFEPEVIEFIREQMTEQNLDQFIQKLEQEHPEFWTNKMDLVHRNTLKVLREGVLTGRIETPHQLLNILTQAQYDQYLVV